MKYHTVEKALENRDWPAALDVLEEDLLWYLERDNPAPKMATRHMTTRLAMMAIGLNNRRALELMEMCCARLVQRHPDAGYAERLLPLIRKWLADWETAIQLVDRVPQEGIEYGALARALRREGWPRVISVLSALIAYGRLEAIGPDLGGLNSKGKLYRPSRALATDEVQVPELPWEAVSRILKPQLAHLPDRGLSPEQAQFYDYYRARWSAGEPLLTEACRPYVYVALRELLEADPYSPEIHRLAHAFPDGSWERSKIKPHLVDHYLLTGNLEAARLTEDWRDPEVFLTWLKLIPDELPTEVVREFMGGRVGIESQMTASARVALYDDVEAALAEILSTQDENGQTPLEALAEKLIPYTAPVEVIEKWMETYAKYISLDVREEQIAVARSGKTVDRPPYTPGERLLFNGTAVAKRIEWPSVPTVFGWQRNVVMAHARSLVRDAENLVRERKGLPRIGESWVSEIALLRLIEAAFPDLTVVHQGRPEWLRPQSLDIYLPEVGVAIEYQGEQHSRPVELFGGEEAFARQLQRDERKRTLCEENDCSLIEVHPDYDPHATLLLVRKSIAQRRE